MGCKTCCSKFFEIINGTFGLLIYTGIYVTCLILSILVIHGVKEFAKILEIFDPKAANLAKYCWIAKIFLIVLLTTVFVFTAFDFEWLRKRVPGGRCGAPLKLAFNRLQLLVTLITYWLSVAFTPIAVVAAFILWFLKKLCENDNIEKILNALNEVLKEIPDAHQINKAEYFKIRDLVNKTYERTTGILIGMIGFLALFVFFLIASKGAIERSKYAKAAAKAAKDNDLKDEIIVETCDKSEEILTGATSPIL